MSGDLSDPLEPLCSRRLRLRCPCDDDVDALIELLTPAISRWMASWPYPLTASSAIARVESARSLTLGRNAVCCVIERDGAPVGWIEVKRADCNPKIGALGYWIGERHQGSGYASEAAGVLIPKVFSFLELGTIEAGAQPENVGSFSVMRALGMRYVGERPVFAAARGRDEVCSFYALDCPQTAVASGS